jgi:cellulose synthase/poly-beta-1,6-N-acetylglucosamine synthase-like glycosyltransferase
LTQIIVALDGCTDQTAFMLREVHDPRIKLLSYTQNRGKVARTNNILRHAKTDILVLYDADIVLFDCDSTANLIAPLIEKDSSIDLTSGRQVPIVGDTIVEKIANAGSIVWDHAKSYSNNNSIYYCSGGNRAMTRELYSKLTFPKIMAEDIYPYLYAQKINLRFRYVKTPIIKYSLPKTLSDYFKRDKRYTLSPLQHKKLFGDILIAREFTINTSAKLRAMVKAFIQNPFWTVLYIFLFPIPKILAFLDNDKYTSTWKPLSSTRGGGNS